MGVKQVLGMIVTCVVAYLLGSINTSIILTKNNPKGEVRTHGSGNAGMTNVLRTYGIKYAFFTALGDFAKGALAILLGRYVFFPFFQIATIDAGYIAGFFALLGHMFPLYFGFKGGKGVMTGLGILFIIDPLICIILLLITLPIVFFTRIVSLGSIVGALLFPIFTLLSRVIQQRPFLYDTICSAVISLLILFMHRANIRRLFNGTENKFERK